MFIPTRKFERDGRIIYSKVDNEMKDLTWSKAQGVMIHFGLNLYFWKKHIKSFYVPFFWKK